MTVTQEESVSLPISAQKVQNDSRWSHKRNRQTSASMPVHGASDTHDRTTVFSNCSQKHESSDTVRQPAQDRNQTDKMALKSRDVNVICSRMNTPRHDNNVGKQHSRAYKEAQHEAEFVMHQDTNNDNMSTYTGGDHDYG